MNQLKDIHANVDVIVTALIGNGVDVAHIMINFEMKLERAQNIMRQVNNALNLDHALRTGLVSPEQADVLRDAIKFIIRNTDHLIEDLNNINGSGIHEIIEPIRYSLIVKSILETADQRYVGESMWRIVKNKFKRIRYFSVLYETKPMGKVYDFGGDQKNDLSSIPLMNRESALQQV